jgi:hypothetical protein
LARPQVGEAEAPQGFHMDEDVGCPLAAGQEPETTQPVEPFDLRPFEPARGSHGHMGAWRQLGGMDRGRVIHRQDAQHLQPAGALQRLADDARTFVCCLEAITAQRRHVQQHIGHAVVGNDEAVAFGDIKPLDDTSDFDDARSGLVVNSDRLRSESKPGRCFWSNPVGHHDDSSCLSLGAS